MEGFSLANGWSELEVVCVCVCVCLGGILVSNSKIARSNQSVESGSRMCLRTRIRISVMISTDIGACIAPVGSAMELALKSAADRPDFS